MAPAEAKRGYQIVWCRLLGVWACLECLGLVVGGNVLSQQCAAAILRQPVDVWQQIYSPSPRLLEKILEILSQR